MDLKVPFFIQFHIAKNVDSGLGKYTETIKFQDSIVFEKYDL